MSHHHHAEAISRQASGELQKRLFLTVFLNLAITFAELAGGFLANSLALISDAVHNFGDSLSLFLTWLASRISGKQSTVKKTFGFRRVEILAAFINAAALMVICVFLLVEGWKRLHYPSEVKGPLMLVVAFFGLAANFISIRLLHNDKKSSLNVKASYLHLLGDTLSSVAVVVGGILIWLFGISWLDPVLTILISLYIMKETWGVLKQTIDILMQGTPEGLDLREVKSFIEQSPGIGNVHHVHAWNLTDREIHFECHVDLTDDLKISETQGIREHLEKELLEHFGINHLTVQFEHGCCCDKRLLYHEEIRE